jgi:hypothetical protein
VDVKEIFVAEPFVALSGGDASRLLFAKDGTLFMSSSHHRDEKGPQDPMNDVGKILRINLDGSIPSDNPLVAETAVTACGMGGRDAPTTTGAPPKEIYAWALRHPGRRWNDPVTGRPYQVVVVQPHETALNSVESILNIPLTGKGQSPTQSLGNVATVKRVQLPAIINHVNTELAFDVEFDGTRQTVGTIAKNAVIERLPDDSVRIRDSGAELVKGARWLVATAALADCVTRP